MLTYTGKPYRKCLDVKTCLIFLSTGIRPKTVGLKKLKHIAAKKNWKSSTQMSQHCTTMSHILTSHLCNTLHKVLDYCTHGK